MAPHILRFEKLAAHHLRTPFDCGEMSMNQWLTTQALQQHQKGYCSVTVAVAAHEPSVVVAYYSLTPQTLEVTTLPPSLQKLQGRKLHKTTPAVLLSRLAVDVSMKQRGLGSQLLAEAIWDAKKSATRPWNALFVFGCAEPPCGCVLPKARHDSLA